MGLKGKIEAVIYAAEEPVTLEQISLLVKQAVLQEIAEDQARAAAIAADEAAVESVPGDAQAQEAEHTANSPEIETVQPLTEAAESGDVPTEAPEEVAGGQPEQPDGVTEQSAPEAEDTKPCLETETSSPAGEISADSSGSDQNASTGQSTSEPLAEAAEVAPSPVAPKRRLKNEIPPEVKARVREILEELISDYASSDRGMEIRRIAGGFRMATKPEHHDVVKAFAKSLKPPLRLSLPALETLAVVAYKQPVTAPEVGEIRGVDSQGVIATLLDRKLITTAGRKAVIGRPILYKTTKEFLLRFGLKDVSELPSMEEFEKLAQDAGQVDMFEPEEESPAGQSTLHDDAEQDSEATGEAGATLRADYETESVAATTADDSSDANTAGSVLPAQVEAEKADQTAEQPASEESIKN